MGMVNASATLEQLVADSSWLRRLAVALVKDEATAEDLVQDTLGKPERETSTRQAVHSPARPRGLPMLVDTSWSERASAALGFEPVFGAERRRLHGFVIDGTGQGVEGADVELDCGYDDGVKQKQRSGVGRSALPLYPYRDQERYAR